MTYILADNQELTSFALLSLLSQDKGNKVYHTTHKAGLLQLLKDHKDTVVLLDYSLFDFDDEDQMLIISECYAQVQWILISDDLTKSFLRRVIYASHAFSVVFKDESMKVMRDAVSSASEGKRYISQRAMETVLAYQQEDETPTLLTATEVEIVKAIAQGKTTKEIANERFLSIHTVNTHRKNIFRKLGVNTAHEAVKYAIRAGLVDLSEFYI